MPLLAAASLRHSSVPMRLLQKSFHRGHSRSSPCNVELALLTSPTAASCDAMRSRKEGSAGRSARREGSLRSRSSSAGVCEVADEARACCGPPTGRRSPELCRAAACGGWTPPRPRVPEAKAGGAEADRTGAGASAPRAVGVRAVTGAPTGGGRRAAGRKTAGSMGAAPKRGAATENDGGSALRGVGCATAGGDGERLRGARRSGAGEGERLRPSAALRGAATGGGETYPPPRGLGAAERGERTGASGGRPPWRS